MTLDNMTGITEGSYTGFCKSQLITCNFVKACNGVCPFEDALKHADKEMDEQTVINHDRDWIIGCIEHDGFIHTHRFDKANQIIHDALSADTSSDLISRADAIEAVRKELVCDGRHETHDKTCRFIADVLLSALPSAELTVQTPQTYGKSIHPSNAEVVEDLISRADAIEAVRLETGKLGRGLLGKGDILDIISALPSAETHEIRTETHGVCLISKDDAVETVCRTRCGDKAKGCPAHSCLVIEEFDALPSADAVQGEWIPCSERLPIPPTFCLVTTDGSHGDVIDIALYMSDGWHKASEVIAWKPLPKPYREDGE